VIGMTASRMLEFVVMGTVDVKAARGHGSDSCWMLGFEQPSRLWWSGTKPGL
jgi:hypothetical protein